MSEKVWIAISRFMIAATMIFAVACAKQAAQSQPEAAAPAPNAAAAATNTGPAPAERPPADAAAAFGLQNVNFDFDSAALSLQARQILNGKAEYLHANPAVAFTVEGHCDARGTSAYNMALGERRAEMVKQYLIYQGISAKRMNTISYGEERPLATDQDETAWARNRRAQFVTH